MTITKFNLCFPMKKSYNLIKLFYKVKALFWDFLGLNFLSELKNKQ